MTRRTLLLTGVLLLLVLTLTVIVKFSLDALSIPPWGNPVGDSLSAEIAGDTHVGQQFIAPLPGLYAIEVALDPATVNSTREVTFHLKTDPSAATDLWTASFSTNAVHPGTPFSAEFERQDDSKDQTYYFYFESTTSTPDNAIAVRYAPRSTLDGASAYLNDQPVDGNLQFHTFYSLRTRDRLDLLLTRMIQGRPYFLGAKGFYIGLAIVYALVLGVFLLHIARIVLAEQAKKDDHRSVS